MALERQPRSLAEKQAVLRAIDEKDKTGKTVADICKEFGVGKASLYMWIEERKKGTLKQNSPGRPKKAAAEVVEDAIKRRRTFETAFKEHVLYRYTNRGDQSVEDLAAEFGITATLIQSWRGQGVKPIQHTDQEKKAPPVPGSVAAAIVKAEPREVVRAKVHAPTIPKTTAQLPLELSDPEPMLASGTAHMEIAALRHKNATLKQVVQLLLEQL